MSLLLVRHFESMTILFNYYTSIIEGNTLPYNSVYLKAGVDPDTQKNSLLSIMRTPRALEIGKKLFSSLS